MGGIVFLINAFACALNAAIYVAGAGDAPNLGFAIFNGLIALYCIAEEAAA